MSDSKPGEPRARRESGSRMQISEPVVFHGTGDDIRGWTLNISRGGIRAIVDTPVTAGDHYDAFIGEGGTPRPGRVVWIKPDKGGGCILGFAFDDAASAPPPAPFSTMPPSRGQMPSVDIPAPPSVPKGTEPDGGSHDG